MATRITWGDKYVDSMTNYSSFCAWITDKSVPIAEIEDVINCIYFVLHDAPDYACPQPMVFKRDGRSFTLRTLMCSRIRSTPVLKEHFALDDFCVRCSNEVGGYMFRWTDARWTPQLSQGTADTASQELRRACLSRQFPDGLLRNHQHVRSRDTTTLHTALPISAVDPNSEEKEGGDGFGSGDGSVAASSSPRRPP